MAPVDIHHLTLGPLEVNTYIAGCTATRLGVIIDPGGEPDRILQVVEDQKFTITHILNTHGHPDHVAANRQLQTHLDIPTAMHIADQPFLGAAAVSAQGGLHTIGLADGDIIPVGNLGFEVLHTPGHTPGSVCFLVDGNLFSGDTLFVGAVGRTDTTGGDFATLLKSIETKLLGLPLETVIWPGHDYGPTPTSTIGHERATNPYITDFILGA